MGGEASRPATRQIVSAPKIGTSNDAFASPRERNDEELPVALCTSEGVLACVHVRARALVRRPTCAHLNPRSREEPPPH